MNLNLGLGAGGEQWEGGRGPPRRVPSRASPLPVPRRHHSFGRVSFAVKVQRDRPPGERGWPRCGGRTSSVQKRGRQPRPPSRGQRVDSVGTAVPGSGDRPGMGQLRGQSTNADLSPLSRQSWYLG